MERIVVCDAGPLIALAKLDYLHLLGILFERAYVPHIVAREVVAKQNLEALRLHSALGEIISIVDTSTIPAAVQNSRIARSGEGYAMALALHLDAYLLIDEKTGRRIAAGLGIEIIGTLAVLIRAKELRLISSIAPSIAYLRGQGYRLSDTLVARALVLADESDTPSSLS